MRSFINFNRRISASFDRMLPEDYRTDGNTYFRCMLPDLIEEGALIYELGGGSRPFLKPSEKTNLRVRVRGLDVDEAELAAAPLGSYDTTVVADLATFRGEGDADLVICQAVLEHVKDTAGAIAAISSVLRPGGRAAIFVPCRNAWFARLNRLLPQGLKEKLLYAIFPSKAEGHDGFVAHYDRCTPQEMTHLSEQEGLKVEKVLLFWTSSYFSFFFPLYFLWRIWTLIARKLGKNFCETFILVLSKRGTSEISQA